MDALGTLHTPLINILLIEDNVSAAEAISETLFSPMIQIESAYTLSVAREKIVREDTIWHCWVLDLHTGEKDNGLLLMKEFSYFPFIVILSGLKNMRLSFHAAQLGVLDVFDKSPGCSLSDFADAVYRVAVLGYLLKGKRSDYLPIFLALKNHVFTSAPQWARFSCISLRYLERLCELHFGLSPRYVLPLYYHLFSSIYLSEPNGDLSYFKQQYSHSDRNFFHYCNVFVADHLQSIYNSYCHYKNRMSLSCS